MKKSFNQKLELNLEQMERLSDSQAKQIIGGDAEGTKFTFPKETAVTYVGIDNTQTTIRQTVPSTKK